MSDNPFVRPIVSLDVVQPKARPDGTMILVVERIEPAKTPRYEVGGKVTCNRCDEWCWLSIDAFEPVRAGEVTAICRECATEIGVHVHGKPMGKLK